MKKYLLLAVFGLILSMVVASCSQAGEQNETAVPGSTLGVTEGAGGTGLEETPYGGVTSSTNEPLTGTLGTATQAIPSATVTLTPVATEPMTGTQTGGITATQVVTGTQQLPSTGAANAARLSNLFGLAVVNQKGENLGTARDYILNLCEAHILYIVVRPTSSLGIASGENVLIPYEMVSVKGGQLNVNDRKIVLNVNPSELQGAPSFTQAGLDLSSVDWENEVMTFWAGKVDMTLTSECKVEAPAVGGELHPIGTPYPTIQATGAITMSQPGGTITQTTPTLTAGTSAQGTPSATQGVVAVHKIAFASKVLTAQVQDGNGTPLGDVEDVLLTPNSGRLDFVAVRLDISLQPDGKLVLVPLRALNLREAEAGTLDITLVLLVDTEILRNAPAISDLPTDLSQGWGADVFDYWSQYVQMTR